MVAHFVSVVVIVKQLASGGFRGLRTRSDDVITLRRRRRHAWECRSDRKLSSLARMRDRSASGDRRRGSL